MSAFNNNAVLGGIGTYTVAVPDASVYLVDCKLTLPTIVGGAGASSVVTVVKVNASTKYTGNAGDEGVRTQVLCAAGDTISVQTSSSAAVDNVPNAVKCIIAISGGV